MPNKSQTSDDDLSPVRRRIAKKTVVKIVVLGAIIFLAIIYLAWDIIAHGPLMTLLSNREQLVTVVKNAGFFGPLVYILLQITQTVVAPIPGQVVGSIGGFLFGPWGILWTSIGTLVGCFIVIKISRRFGRPLIERIFKKTAVERFDFVINSKSAALVIFLIFLLPGFPDDLLCYITGLTDLSTKKIMALILLGRLPTIIVTNYIGSGISTNIGAVVAVSLVTVLILGIIAWQRERIIKFLKREKD